MKIDLDDLTFENLDRWPFPIKIIAIAIAFCMIIFAGYWFVNKQQLAQIESAKSKEQTLRQTFQVKQQLAANYIAYKQQLVEIKQTFGAMLRQLPSTTEVPGLLEDISQAGIASGLTFQLFKPLPEIQHEFYAELPIQIQVIGNYHQLAAFVSKIVNLDRIVTLHDFSINYHPNLKSEINPNALVMEITAKTYRYSEESKDKP